MGIQCEQASLEAVKTGVEVKVKPEIGFLHFDSTRPSHTSFTLIDELPYFAAVNAEHQQKFFQWDFETDSQAEKLVNAGN